MRLVPYLYEYCPEAAVRIAQSEFTSVPIAQSEFTSGLIPCSSIY